MQRGYDLIAPVYDKLSRLVYGNALRNAQKHFLPLIPASSTILIAGGGTGWILEEMARVHHEGLYIDYIDSSAKMIEQAKSKSCGNNEVHFINQSVFQWKAYIDYDVIVTPFFFDNFQESNTQKVFSLLHSALRTNGFWLYTDFQVDRKNAYWQRAMLAVMYTFFRLTAGIEAKRLPDVKSIFQSHHYELIKEESFFHQFINTSVYKKLIPGDKWLIASSDI